MEKKAKASGNRLNPNNGSVHRHGHMSSSAAAVGIHGRPGNLNHHHEQSIRRSRSFCGRPFQTEKAGEASSSSSKLKKNTATMLRRPKTHPELLNRDDQNTATMLRRPKTHPELLNRDDHPVLMNNKKMNTPVDQGLSANKLLVNVTVAQSSGPLRLLLSSDAAVEDVIKATLLLYAKEGRKPLLNNDPTSFGLHYSQFSIDCLNPTDKIKDMGSRNFFLCSKEKAKESRRLSFHSGEIAVTDRSGLSPPSCGKEMQNISRITEPWYKQLRQCLLTVLMDWDILVRNL